MLTFFDFRTTQGSISLEVGADLPVIGLIPLPCDRTIASVVQSGKCLRLGAGIRLTINGDCCSVDTASFSTTISRGNIDGSCDSLSLCITATRIGACKRSSGGSTGPVPARDFIAMAGCRDGLCRCGTTPKPVLEGKPI